MTSSSPHIRESLFSPRLILGLGVALFGVILMLDRLDVVDAGSLLRFWPLILIAVGLQQFLNPREHVGGRRVPVSGIIWIAIGGFLLLNSFGLLRVSIWQLFWPAVLIAFGVRLMMRPGMRNPTWKPPVSTAASRSCAAPSWGGGSASTRPAGAAARGRMA